MIKLIKKICWAFTLIIALSYSVNAQYINLQIKIEPELSATVEQDLNFGTQVTNSGRTEIQLGDVNMGVFSIKAFHTQNVYLNLNYPNSLTNDNPAVDVDIPLELNLAYNNSGNNNANNSLTLPASGGFVSIHEYTALESRNDVWKQMYLYVYGAIEVGNIPNGVYTGDIVLSVDYD
jgi:hypothetical protein